MKRVIPLLTAMVLAACLTILTACSAPTTNNQNASNANASPTATEKQTPKEEKAPVGGSIEIISTPPGAAVVLIADDGAGPPKTYGLTPTTVTGLTPGKYTVHLEKQGYKFFQKEVEVKEGPPVKVDAKLRKE